MKRWHIVLMLLGVILAACSGSGQPNTTGIQSLKLAPISRLSPEARKAPVTVREAYQFAIANPEILSRIPCYCGCGSMGHKSNLDCYVKEFKPDGSLALDDHALGCSLCVDITHDATRLTSEGKSVDEIRAEIVKTFSPYGPPNQ